MDDKLGIMALSRLQESWSVYTQGVRIVIALLAGMLLFACSLWVMGVEYHASFLTLNATLNQIFPEWLWASLTRLGDERVLILLSVFFIKRKPELFVALLWATLFGLIASRGGKLYFDTLRPAGVLANDLFTIIGPKLTGHAFPSGHTITTFVFFMTLVIFSKTVSEKVLLIIVGLLAGLSRVAVGAHWPIDVLGGSVFGAIAALLGFYVSAFFNFKINKKAFWVFAHLPWIAAISLILSNNGNPHLPLLVYPLIFSQLWLWINDHQDVIFKYAKTYANKISLLKLAYIFPFFIFGFLVLLNDILFFEWSHSQIALILFLSLLALFFVSAIKSPTAFYILITYMPWLVIVGLVLSKDLEGAKSIALVLTMLVFIFQTFSEREITNNFLRWFLLLILIVTQGFFIVYSHADLAVSNYFYSTEMGWYFADHLLVGFSYQVFRWMPYFLVPLLLIMFFSSGFRRLLKNKISKKMSLFLLLSLLIGPGFIVHAVFKYESGRARPASVLEFDGNSVYSPPFVKSDQCIKNCSFVSGHAAMGFYFVVLAWLLKSRVWVFFGGVIGLLVGLGRVAQGAHFASDIILSFFVVLLCTLLTSKWILGYWFPQKDNAKLK